MPVHVAPPSVDFHITTLQLNTMFASFGCATSGGRSPPPIRPAGRRSVVISLQLSPASSERNSPTPPPRATDAYSRFGSLGATAISACPTGSGKPVVSRCHLAPPAIDLLMPPP